MLWVRQSSYVRHRRLQDDDPTGRANAGTHSPEGSKTAQGTPFKSASCVGIFVPFFMRIADDSAFVQKKQRNHLLCGENLSAGVYPNAASADNPRRNKRSSCMGMPHQHDTTTWDSRW